MDWLYVLAGLAFLVVAGDALVKGAVNFAFRLGIPALIVSLTIVAFGTSAPELIVSVQAILDGVPELALGNVVGSNIANVLLVLGIPAVISTIHSSQLDTRVSYWTMLGASVLLVALAWNGRLGLVEGLILLAGLAAMISHAIWSAGKQRTAAPEVEGLDSHMGWPKICTYIIAGLIGLPIGANLLVSGATNIALAYNVDEAIIGLTLVAVGTSLPELATSIAAAFRKQADVAMGNVIGSNIFNILCILGISSLFGMPVGEQFLQLDLWVMLATALLLIPFTLMKRDIGKLAGFGLIGLYGAYLFVLL